MRKFAILLSFMILTCLLAPEIRAQAAPKKYVKSVSVEPPTEEITVGENATVDVTVEAQGTLSRSQLGVMASSSNKSIVAVKVSGSLEESGEEGDSEITLTAKKAGTARITITTKGKTKSGKALKKTFTVKVINSEYVKEITAPDEVAAVVRKPKEVTVAVEANEPLSADRLKVSVKSSKTSVVTAKVTAGPSGEGSRGESVITLTPKKKGTATITVTASTKDRNGKSVTKKFKVKVAKEDVVSGTGFTKNDYTVEHSTVEKTVRFKINEEKVSVDELKAQGYTVSEDGKEATRTSVYARSVYTFQKLPGTLEELKAFDLKSEVRQVTYNGTSYDIDYGMLKPAVASVLAIHSFQATNRLDTNNPIAAMFDYLNAASEVSNVNRQFINGQLIDYPGLINCYFGGATPANGYQPSEPFTVTVEEGPYYIPAKSTINGGRPATCMAFVKHSGNDSGETPIDVYLADDGNWYSYSDQFKNLLASPRR